MYKQVKVKGFTPYQEVTHSDGTKAIGKDGNPLMKRTVVIDGSYISERGEQVEESYVCDCYKASVTDEQLQGWLDKQTLLHCWFFPKAKQAPDGKWYQGVALTRISETYYN